VRSLTNDRIVSRRYLAEDIILFARIASVVQAANGGRFTGDYLLNLDEKGMFQKRHKANGKALAVLPGKPDKGVKPAAKFSISNKKGHENVTVILTMSASNAMATPYFVFRAGPGVSHDGLHRKAEDIRRKNATGADYGFAFTPKGVITHDSWRKYVTGHLLPWIADHRRRRGIPADDWLLLTMDGAGTIHTTLPDVLEAFRAARVHVFKFLSHTSHLRQPLDLVPNAMLEQEFSSRHAPFMRQLGDKYCALHLPLLVNACLASITSRKLDLGECAFRKAGLFDEALVQLHGQAKDNLSFLCDQDLLSWIDGDTTAQRQESLRALHDSVPWVNLNFLATLSAQNFTEYYRGQMIEMEQRKSAVPEHLKGIILPYLQRQEDLAKELGGPQPAVGHLAMPAVAAAAAAAAASAAIAAHRFADYAGVATQSNAAAAEAASAAVATAARTLSAAAVSVASAMDTVSLRLDATAATSGGSGELKYGSRAHLVTGAAYFTYVSARTSLPLVFITLTTVAPQRVLQISQWRAQKTAKQDRRRTMAQERKGLIIRQAAYRHIARTRGLELSKKATAALAPLTVKDLTKVAQVICAELGSNYDNELILFRATLDPPRPKGALLKKQREVFLDRLMARFAPRAQPADISTIPEPPQVESDHETAESDSGTDSSEGLSESDDGEDGVDGESSEEDDD
jgi:hypothetical protein